MNPPAQTFEEKVLERIQKLEHQQSLFSTEQTKIKGRLTKLEQKIKRFENSLDSGELRITENGEDIPRHLFEDSFKQSAAQSLINTNFQGPIAGHIDWVVPDKRFPKMGLFVQRSGAVVPRIVLDQWRAPTGYQTIKSNTVAQQSAPVVTQPSAPIVAQPMVQPNRTINQPSVIVNPGGSGTRQVPSTYQYQAPTQPRVILDQFGRPCRECNQGLRAYPNTSSGSVSYTHLTLPTIYSV